MDPYRRRDHDELISCWSQDQVPVIHVRQMLTSTAPAGQHNVHAAARKPQVQGPRRTAEDPSDGLNAG